jgi:hypothetical protein
MSYLARLLDDDQIRPTTQEGTKTPIRVAHEVLVVVRYDRPDMGGSIRELSARRKVSISSVCGPNPFFLIPSAGPLTYVRIMVTTVLLPTRIRPLTNLRRPRPAPAKAKDIKEKIRPGSPDRVFMRYDAGTAREPARVSSVFQRFEEGGRGE